MKKARKTKRSDASRKLTKREAALSTRLHEAEKELFGKKFLGEQLGLIRERNFVLEKTLEQRDQALTELRKLVASLNDVVGALVTRALEAKR